MHDGYDGPDGIDEDPLPVQDRTQAACRPYGPQKGSHDRGPRHDDHGAEENGDAWSEAQNEDRGTRNDAPGDEHARGDESSDDGMVPADIGNGQGHAALEKDDADGQGHDDEEQLPEHLIGTYDAGDRTGDEAKDQ